MAWTLVIVLSALASEGLVRALVPVSDFFWEFDPHVGVKLIPNKHGRSVQSGVFDVSVQTNAQGFRDVGHAYEKRPGSSRVVLLGDSFIEAMQVPFEQSVAPLLEDRLQGGGDVEVINLGVSGFGTAREYLMLRQYGLRYNPDLVLLFFVGNDISDNSQRLQGLPYVPYPVPGRNGDVAKDETGSLLFTAVTDQTSSLGVLTDVLRRYSKAYRLLREATAGSPSINEILYSLGLMSTPPERVNRPRAESFGYYEIYRLSPTDTWREAWALTEHLLVATRDLAEANGARFAVILVPAAWEVDSSRWEGILRKVPAMREVPMDIEHPSRRLSAFLSLHGIPHIPLLADFRRLSPSRPPLYFSRDGHWTAEGHRLAADLLQRPVRDLLTADAAVNGRALQAAPR
jgi:hypothetical protein